jgi:hypothetical protein
LGHNFNGKLQRAYFETWLDADMPVVAVRFLLIVVGRQYTLFGKEGRYCPL